jgi:hypothetical protein
LSMRVVLAEHADSQAVGMLPLLVTNVEKGVSCG